MKPKNNYKPGPKDLCQTPPYGIVPLLEFLPRDKVIWEPAAGMGVMVDTLRLHGYTVISTSIETGKDFFKWEEREYDIIVTNPPYGNKYKWLDRCYELSKPFALLMPVETIGAARAQRHFRKFGVEVIYLDKRIDFIMPFKGLNGNGAQFPVSWYTYGLHIGKQNLFVELDKPKKEDIRAWWEEWKHFYEPEL